MHHSKAPDSLLVTIKVMTSIAIVSRARGNTQFAATEQALKTLSTMMHAPPPIETAK